ncbi:hypothetical protein WJX73_003701 [Symbiochloris irregularis]|uniref:Secreted protein n=1 Tax=Symbiochloris irregularis TaxID=706552 RepID=A0AAW1NZQ6_9CHLO
MRTALAVVFLLVIGQQVSAGRYLLQENRIGDGAGAVLDAAGATQAGGAVAAVSDADDGDLTNDLANTGQDVGQLQLDTLPAAGNEVPGRRKLLQPGGEH